MHGAIAKEHDIRDQIFRDLFKNASQGWAASLFFTIEHQFDGDVGHLIRSHQGINGRHQGNDWCFIVPGRARDNTP